MGEGRVIAEQAYVMVLFADTIEIDREMRCFCGDRHDTRDNGD